MEICLNPDSKSGKEYYATANQSRETSAEEKGDSDYVRMAKGDV